LLLAFCEGDLTTAPRLKNLLRQKNLWATWGSGNLAGTHFIERLVHLGDDVEAIENVHRIAATLADDVQIRLSHIRANVFDLLRHGCANQGEELLEALDRAFLADPEQPCAFLLDLVDERQILVPFAILDFVHADGEDRAQAAMR
jgi:hypothetical protein